MLTLQVSLISILCVFSTLCADQRLFAYTEIPDGGRYDNTIAELISRRSMNVILREPATGKLWQADVTKTAGNISCSEMLPGDNKVICQVLLHNIFLNCIDFDVASKTTNGFGYHYMQIKTMQMEIVAESRKDQAIVLKEVNDFSIQSKTMHLSEDEKMQVDLLLSTAIPAIFKHSSCISLY